MPGVSCSSGFQNYHSRKRTGAASSSLSFLTIIIFLLCAANSLFSVVSAATLYVDSTSGSDLQLSCLIAANPCKSIARAVAIGLNNADVIKLVCQTSQGYPCSFDWRCDVDLNLVLNKGVTIEPYLASSPNTYPSAAMELLFNGAPCSALQNNNNSSLLLLNVQKASTVPSFSFTLLSFRNMPVPFTAIQNPTVPTVNVFQASITFTYCSFVSNRINVLRSINTSALKWSGSVISIVNSYIAQNNAAIIKVIDDVDPVTSFFNLYSSVVVNNTAAVIDTSLTMTLYNSVFTSNINAINLNAQNNLGSAGTTVYSHAINACTFYGNRETLLQMNFQTLKSISSNVYITASNFTANTASMLKQRVVFCSQLLLKFFFCTYVFALLYCYSLLTNDIKFGFSIVI